MGLIMKCWFKPFISAMGIAEISCPTKYFKEASSIGFFSSCILWPRGVTLLHQIQIAEDARVEV